MAIAGLHNVPVLEPTISRESQSSSSSSGRHESQRRISTASILQMWRELEDECAVNRVNERGRLRLQQDNSDSVSNCQEEMGRGALEDLGESENGSVDNSESQMETLNEHEDRQSMTSEQSQDIGEVERERVRQIFREWMNSGVNAQRSNVPLRGRSSRSQLLGQNERERVKIVREWIQTTSQPDALSGNREEQVGEIGSQIVDVREGQVLGRNEGQAENSRRGFRRLCGRQFLVDLLAKKEQERRLELQHLEETRPVTGFAHRNRIQVIIVI